MHSVNVKVPSSTGLLMAATLDLPDTDPVAYAMFAHCFTGSRFTPAASRVSKTLAESGIACLRFDFPGLGQSEGNFSETSFSSNVADINAAATWLAANYCAPQLLIGHSLGGAAALKAAPGIGSLRAVATIGAPFDPAHAVLHFADRISDVDEQGAVTLTLGGRDVTISRDFLEDLAETNPEDHLRRLRRPLLLLHSPVDQTVGVDNAQLIFQVTRYPKSLISLDKADHLLTRDGGRNLGTTPISLLVSALAAATSQSIRAAARESRITTLDDVHVAVSRVVGGASGEVHLRRQISLIGELSADERTELLAAAGDSEIERLLSHGIVIEDEDR